MYLAFTFALVAVKTLAWAHDDEAPKETVTFEYGGLNIDYWQQAPDGSLVQAPQKGWNRVKNIAADTLDTLKIV
jgi:type VI protein secretion system component Hcp